MVCVGSIRCQQRGVAVESRLFSVEVFEADGFQNLHVICSFLSTDTSLVDFSLRSVQQFLRKVASGEIDTQTPSTNLHNLFGR